MNNTKYVVARFGGMETVFIFPGFVSHAEFVSLTNFDKEQVVSAGFVMVDGNSLTAYGESVTLGIKSREEDNFLLKQMFNDYF